MVRIPTHREPTRPGEMLLEESLEPMGLTQRDLADGIRVPDQRVNELVSWSVDIATQSCILSCHDWRSAMRFLTVRDLRSKAAEIWRDLPQEREMVLTHNGRPVAILAAVSESSFEDSIRAVRQARAMQAVAELQRESARQGTDKITSEEIDAEIRSVRKKRSR